MERFRPCLDPEWEVWKAIHLPYLPPTAPPKLTNWRWVMAPAGKISPREAHIADFQWLRQHFEPPVPQEQRQFYGPPPSDPKMRLYERKATKGLLGGLNRRSTNR